MGKIDEYRKSQPIQELRRKRDKAWRRQQIWTQEDIDYGEAEGRRLAKFFGTLPVSRIKDRT